MAINWDGGGRGGGWHEHWYGPQPDRGEMRGHQHDGGGEPHHHVWSATSAPVTIPQADFEELRRRVAVVHAAVCEHLRPSVERFGVGPGGVSVATWSEGMWVVECATPHRAEWRAEGPTAVAAMLAFIALHE